MADKDIQMHQRNTDNTDYDNLYPHTKAKNIILDDGTPDYVRLPGYAADTGSANAYAATLSPTPSTYADGMGVVVKIANANTGASTINVNSLGAKTIKNPDGTDLTSGDLAAGGIYSFKYNATTGNFILVGKGGVKLTGTAGDAQVLNGYSYYNTDPKTKRTGSMANNGAITIIPGTVDQTIAQGYHNGSGKVSGDANLTAPNIVSGKSIFNVAGNFPNSCIKSIQRGTMSFTASDKTFTATISSVDTTKAIVRVSNFNTDGAAYEDCFSIKLTNATTITVARQYAGGGTITVCWEVIEFNNVKSIQRGEIVNNSSKPATATISSVNTAKALMFLSFSSCQMNSNPSYFMANYQITSATSISIDGYSGTFYSTYEWQVIEFN